MWNQRRRDPELVAIARRLVVSDPSAAVRKAALATLSWRHDFTAALNSDRIPEFDEVLLRIAVEDPDAEVRLAAVNHLYLFTRYEPRAVDVLADRARNDPDEDVRSSAEQALPDDDEYEEVTEPE